ncbi:MAG TPA: tetratricopeptide repeat protein, partial [Trebonia sp.]
MVAAAGYGKTSLLRHRFPGATWTSEPGGFGEGVTIIDDLPALTPDRAQALLAEAEQMPSGARLAIATRFPLPVSTARLRGRGLLAEVRPAELALSADQVTDLLAAEYGVRDPDLCDEIYEATLGWPALVRLSGEAVAAGEPVLAQPGSPLWTFLSEEVLAPLPDPARALLTDLAELAPVTADLGEALGHRDAAASLRLLAAIGLLRDNRVVPMVAHVARDRSAPGRVAMLAALWYEEAGHPAAALKSFAQAGDLVQCGRLLEAQGEEILAAGRGALVIDVLQRLEKRSRAQQLLLGDAIRMAGSALNAAQAYAVVADAEPVWDSAVAWRMGMLHYHRGDSKAALAEFDRAPADEPPSRDRSHLLSWTACAHLQLGDTATAVDLANAASRNASAAGDDLALATAYVTLALCNNVSGRDADSEELDVQALEMAEKAGSVVLRARILTSRTFRLLCEARYVDALEASRQNAFAATLAGHANLRSISYSNQGDALMMLGRYDEAIRQYERAEATSRRQGSRRSATSYLGLGEVYRRRGWVEQARAAYETALQLAEDGGLQQVRVNALCGLARMLAPVDAVTAAAHADL